MDLDFFLEFLFKIEKYSLLVELLDICNSLHGFHRFPFSLAYCLKVFLYF